MARAGRQQRKTGVRSTRDRWQHPGERAMGTVPTDRTGQPATGRNAGSLHAGLPARRAPRNILRTGGVGGESARAWIAAGLPLSGAALSGAAMTSYGFFGKLPA